MSRGLNGFLSFSCELLRAEALLFCLEVVPFVRALLFTNPPSGGTGLVLLRFPAIAVMWYRQCHFK